MMTKERLAIDHKNEKEVLRLSSPYTRDIEKSTSLTLMNSLMNDDLSPILFNTEYIYLL